VPTLQCRPRIPSFTGKKCKFLDNHWASTKFCVSQFKGRKSANKALREAVIKAKGYSDLDALVEPWTGGDEFAAIKAAIDARSTAPPILLPADETTPPPPPSEEDTETTTTPPGWRGNPDPTVVHDAPLLPANEHRIMILADVSKQDPGTPTPLAVSRPVPVPNVLPVM
jgi:tRNA-dihydrouridine synthase 2